MTPQPQISPERFKWENFLSKQGYSQTDVFEGFPSFKIRKDVEVIGYCPSSRLVVRPRPDGWAVLVRFPESGEECWLHWMEEKSE